MDHQIVEANGQRLACQITGHGPPMLLITGFGLPMTAWEQQVASLSRRYTVVTFDNRGIGKSAPTEHDYAIADLADDAAALLEVLGIDRAHIVGASMGGYVSQDLALRHASRVDQLVLISSTCNVRRFRAKTFATLFSEVHRVAPHLLPLEYALWSMTPNFIANEDAFSQLYDDLENALATLDPAEYRRQAAAINDFDVSRRIGNIRAPTLVLVGDGDKISPPDESRFIAATIPRAEFRIIPSAGHGAIFERPERVNGSIINFLNQFADIASNENAGRP